MDSIITLLCLSFSNYSSFLFTQLKTSDKALAAQVNVVTADQEFHHQHNTVQHWLLHELFVLFLPMICQCLQIFLLPIENKIENESDQNISNHRK